MALFSTFPIHLGKVLLPPPDDLLYYPLGHPLSRVDFGVGTGSTWGIDWSSERTVAHAVKVTVDLVATRKP